MALRVVNRARFFGALVAVIGLVLAVAGFAVTRSDGGRTHLSAPTTLRSSTTTGSTTTTVVPSSTTPTTGRLTTSTVRHAATATTARAKTTTVAPVCGMWQSIFSYESDSSEKLLIRLYGNTSFNNQPVRFDMRYTPPAYGDPSYPTQSYRGNVSTTTAYSMTFEVAKSMSGGALYVTARSDGNPSTCESPQIQIHCCLGPPSSDG